MPADGWVAGRGPGPPRMPAGACSAAVSLEQSQPDFAEGGEGGDGVPEPVEGDFAGDGDGGGVDEFADAGAGEGDAGDGAPVGVDEHAGVAAVVLAVLVGTGDVGEVVVDDLDAAAALFDLAAGQADGGDFGGGEDDLGDGGRVGGGDVRAPGASSTCSLLARAPMTAPAMRAWYLP